MFLSFQVCFDTIKKRHLHAAKWRGVAPSGVTSKIAELPRRETMYCVCVCVQTMNQLNAIPVNKQTYTIQNHPCTAQDAIQPV